MQIGGGTYVHAFKVDKVASIFSIGGHCPNNSTCTGKSFQIHQILLLCGIAAYLQGFQTVFLGMVRLTIAFEVHTQGTQNAVQQLTNSCAASATVLEHVYLLLVRCHALLCFFKFLDCFFYSRCVSHRTDTAMVELTSD